MQKPLLLRIEQLSDGLSQRQKRQPLWLLLSQDEWDKLSRTTAKPKTDERLMVGEMTLTTYFVGGEVILVPSAFGSKSNFVDAVYVDDKVIFSDGRRRHKNAAQLVFYPCGPEFVSSGKGAQTVVLYDGAHLFCR